MKSCGIILPFARNFMQHDFYIGVDKGAYVLIKAEMVVDYCVGDFDSCSQMQLDIIKKHAKEMQIYPVTKDFTDTELALKYAIEKGFDNIVIYGGLQRRIDHSLANLNLLIRYDANIILKDEFNTIRILKKGQHRFEKQAGFVSFMPYQSTNITLKGFKYPLDNYQLQAFDSLCISNEIVEQEAFVECDNNIICLISHD